MILYQILKIFDWYNTINKSEATIISACTQACLYFSSSALINQRVCMCQSLDLSLWLSPQISVCIPLCFFDFQVYIRKQVQSLRWAVEVKGLMELKRLNYMTALRTLSVWPHWLDLIIIHYTYFLWMPFFREDSPPLRGKKNIMGQWSKTWWPGKQIISNGEYLVWQKISVISVPVVAMSWKKEIKTSLIDDDSTSTLVSSTLSHLKLLISDHSCFLYANFSGCWMI